jgi:hypothetical protein
LVFVERFIAVELVIDALELVGHLQIHPIRDLTGDFVDAGHEAFEIFHFFS